MSLELSSGEFETHRLPNGVEIKFFPDTHTYVFKDKPLLSVTQLLTKMYGDSYAKVNPVLLERAAQYGTAVHSEIEEWAQIKKDIPSAEIVSKYPEVNNFFNYVVDIYKIQPIMMEKVIILFSSKGVPTIAGRFDMFATVNGQDTLIDIKTTSQIHKQLVTSQLNMYLTGCLHSGYFSDISNINLGVAHLSGETCKYIPIPKISSNFFQKYIDNI